MKALTPDGNLDTFFTISRQSPESALFLDYDGTLAPFQVKREEARPYDGIPERLSRIAQLPTCRLVIISGRALRDLVPLLNWTPLPELWGSHGRERRFPNGTITTEEISTATEAGLQRAMEWARSEGLSDRLEDKRYSVGLHWRGMAKEDIAELDRRTTAAWIPLTVNSDLRLHRFDGGLELRALGVDKGKAVGTLLSEVKPSSIVAYAGDDATDEDAFHAMAGRGLRILVREEFRDTAADLWLVPPAELLEFLDRWWESRRGQNTKE